MIPANIPFTKEDRFNKKYRYPYTFLNEQPFSEEFKQYVQIISGIYLYLTIYLDESLSLQTLQWSLVLFRTTIGTSQTGLMRKRQPRHGMRW